VGDGVRTAGSGAGGTRCELTGVTGSASGRGGMHSPRRAWPLREGAKLRNAPSICPYGTRSEGKLKRECVELRDCARRRGHWVQIARRCGCWRVLTCPKRSASHVPTPLRRRNRPEPKAAKVRGTRSMPPRRKTTKFRFDGRYRHAQVHSGILSA
jgi:hypothetical protein